MITRFFLDVGLLSSAERAIEAASFSVSLTSSAGAATVSSFDSSTAATVSSTSGVVASTSFAASFSESTVSTCSGSASTSLASVSSTTGSATSSDSTSDLGSAVSSKTSLLTIPLLTSSTRCFLIKLSKAFVSKSSKSDNFVSNFCDVTSSRCCLIYLSKTPSDSVIPAFISESFRTASSMVRFLTSSKLSPSFSSEDGMSFFSDTFWSPL